MTMRPCVRLLMVVIGFAAVWCGMLPMLRRLDFVALHIERMEAGGVNPAAMYYTELDRLPVRPAWLEQRIVLWP
ncbi:MAG: hypothetical protein WCO90_08115 [Planctomycetota bacterium]